jgi:multidrug efflux pump subunit AcrA (membrane-fusion protein)
VRARMLAGALTMLALSACGPHEDVAEKRSEPVAIEKVPGTQLTRLVVEPAAVATIGITTANVGANAGADGRRLPSAALLYGPDGAPFVYVRSQENTFDRHPVTVDRVDGDVAVLREGPDEGAAVVTQGAAELVGMEFGLEDE